MMDGKVTPADIEAVYQYPRLIVLDEPNSNLDEEGERALAGAIEKLKADKRTVFVITHRPAALANADRVLIMSLARWWRSDRVTSCSPRRAAAS